MICFVGDDRKRGDLISSCSIYDVVEYCRSKTELGLDIETTKNLPKDIISPVYEPGLDPPLSKIVMLQIGDKDKQFIIDCRVVDISPLIPILSKNPNILFIGHNLKFEAKMLKYHYGIILINIWDTMICEQLLYSGIKQSYSLIEVSRRRLGKQSVTDVNLFNEFDEDGDYIDKGTRLEFLTIGDKPFTDQQIEYGAEDILNPILIREKQLEGRYIDGELWRPLNLFKLENQYVLVLADKELNGMTFEPELWKDTASIKQKEYDHRLSVLNSYVVNNYPDSRFVNLPDLFSSEKTCNILWSSSDQVVKFFLFLGFCPKEKSKQTKKMEYSVGAVALNKLLPKEYKDKLFKSKFPDEINTQEDLILAFLLYNESLQCITTFGIPWLKYIHPITKRVHTSYKQILNTGRLSSSKPNLQQIPSDDLYRRCFTSATGWKLINCDYSAQEVRVLAEITNEPSMVSFFNDGHPIHGDDFHSFVATKIYQILRNDATLIIDKDNYKDERNNAKSTTFLIV